MVAPLQGEVWWTEADDKRGPVLVVTRSDATSVLTRLVVAPITRNIQPINRHLTTTRIATLNPARRRELCGALAALADC
jgi:mRNA interferase MazF